MKRVIRLVISCLVLINVFMVTAFASIPSPEVYTSVNQQSDLCNKNVKYSIGKAQSYARRGTFFDSVDVAITDKGNGDIGVTAHTYLRKPVKELYISLYLDRYNKEKDIMDFFVLICFAFNHQIRFNNSHQFNTPFGKERSSYNRNIENNLTLFCDAIHSKNINFLNTDFLSVDLSALGENDLVYCDPPYLISTGSYNDGKRGFKDWTEKEEHQLLDLLDRLNAHGVMFALSNVFYHKGMSNEILIEWSKNYIVNYIDKSYSNCSYHFKDRNAKTVEVLITNFERREPDCQ